MMNDYDDRYGGDADSDDGVNAGRTTQNDDASTVSDVDARR